VSIPSLSRAPLAHLVKVRPVAAKSRLIVTFRRLAEPDGPDRPLHLRPRPDLETHPVLERRTAPSAHRGDRRPSGVVDQQRHRVHDRLGQPHLGTDAQWPTAGPVALRSQRRSVDRAVARADPAQRQVVAQTHRHAHGAHSAVDRNAAAQCVTVLAARSAERRADTTAAASACFLDDQGSGAPRVTDLGLMNATRSLPAVLVPAVAVLLMRCPPIAS